KLDHSIFRESQPTQPLLFKGHRPPCLAGKGEVPRLPRRVHLLTTPSRSMQPGNLTYSAVSGTRSDRPPTERRPAQQISRTRALLYKPMLLPITFNFADWMR